MPEYKKPKPCTDCGIMTTYRNKKGRCLDCTLQARTESMEQIRIKKGPYYEIWKGRMDAALRRTEE